MSRVNTAPTPATPSTSARDVIHTNDSAHTDSRRRPQPSARATTQGRLVADHNIRASAGTVPTPTRGRHAATKGAAAPACTSTPGRCATRNAKVNSATAIKAPDARPRPSRGASRVSDGESPLVAAALDWITT